MPTERKVAAVADLEDRLQRATIVIGLDYRGLPVAELRELRRALRKQESSIELRVVKNTLAKRAFANTGRGGAEVILNEATALLFGYEEVVTPPKAISEYQREKRMVLPIYGGEMDGTVLSAAEVMELADVPSRTELMAKIAGGVAGPIAGIAMTLSGVLRELASAVDARAQQLEESSAAAASGS